MSFWLKPTALRKPACRTTYASSGVANGSSCSLRYVFCHGLALVATQPPRYTLRQRC